MHPRTTSTLAPVLLVALALLPGLACGPADGEPPADHGDQDAHAGHDHGPGQHDHGDAPLPPPRQAGLVVLEPDDPYHPDLIEFGTLPFGGSHNRVVRLKNLDPVPVTVRNVQAGCACTVPKLSTTDADGNVVYGDMRSRTNVLVVPPGAVAELELEVDTHRAPVKNKDKVVVIRIVTDSEQEPYLSLNVHLKVDTPLIVTPPLLGLPKVPQYGGAEGAVVITPFGDSGRLPTEVLEVPEGLEATLTAPDPSNVARSWGLAVRVLPPVPLGMQEHKVSIGTTGPGGQGAGDPFEVLVRVTGVPDLQVVPARLALVPNQGAPTARCRVVSNLAGRSLVVTEAVVEGDGADSLEVELVPIQPDADGASSSWDVRLAAPEGTDATGWAGKLVLRFSDAQQPVLEIPFIGPRGS